MEHPANVLVDGQMAAESKNHEQGHDQVNQHARVEGVGGETAPFPVPGHREQHAHGPPRHCAEPKPIDGERTRLRRPVWADESQDQGKRQEGQRHIDPVDPAPTPVLVDEACQERSRGTGCVSNDAVETDSQNGQAVELAKKQGPANHDHHAFAQAFHQLGDYHGGNVQRCPAQHVAHGKQAQTGQQRVAGAISRRGPNAGEHSVQQSDPPQDLGPDHAVMFGFEALSNHIVDHIRQDERLEDGRQDRRNGYRRQPRLWSVCWLLDWLSHWRC